jgi:putative toxin-antitoxin system antitoxin component (TIGR02293 family)
MAERRQTMIATVTTISADKLTHLIGVAVDTVPDLIAAVRQGLPFAVFTALQESLGVSAATLAQLIGIPMRTLHRRRREGKFKPDESDSLVRIARVLSHVLELFDDKAEALYWLKTPASALDDSTPLSLLDTEVGAQEVLRLLGQLEHGVFP